MACRLKPRSRIICNSLSMEFTGPKPTGISRQSKPITERRHSVRLRVHSPAYANLDESSQENAGDLNEILDISEEGISIQTTSPLAVDRDLNLNLDLSETRTRIRTAGRWSGPTIRDGLESAFPNCRPNRCVSSGNGFLSMSSPRLTMPHGRSKLSSRKPTSEW